MQINAKKFLLPVLMETVVSKMLSGHSTQDGVFFSEASKKNLSKKKRFFFDTIFRHNQSQISFETKKH